MTDSNVQIRLAAAADKQTVSNVFHEAGLDTDAVYEAVSKGAAQSWQMDNRWKTAARGEFDFGFAVDWMRKDLDIVLNEAKRNGATLPVAATAFTAASASPTLL